MLVGMSQVYYCLNIESYHKSCSNGDAPGLYSRGLGSSFIWNRDFRN
jgi:hypothetical protein